MTDNIVLSPFRYEKAYRIYDNVKGSVSRPEIHQLISTGELSAAHMDIIKLLYKYKYLTSHQMELLYGSGSLRNEEDLPICSVKEAVSFLVKRGLILRHYFSWQEPIDDVLTDRRSVNFYTLSKGTCIYLQKDLNFDIDVDTYMNFDKDFIIYQRLAVASFAAKYINNPRCRHNEFEFRKKAESHVYDTDFIIDCVIKTHIDKKEKNFVLFPVRRNEGWFDELELKLNLLKDHLLYMLAKKQLQEAPAIILLCEDDMHVVEVHVELSKLNLTFSYFYTTDVRQHNDYTYDKLLMVSSDDRGVKYREYKSPLVI